MKTIINGTEMVLMKRFTRELTALSESVIKEVEKQEKEEKEEKEEKNPTS
jgi:hypothetical protein